MRVEVALLSSRNVWHYAATPFRLSSCILNFAQNCFWHLSSFDTVDKTILKRLGGRYPKIFTLPILFYESQNFLFVALDCFRRTVCKYLCNTLTHFLDPIHRIFYRPYFSIPRTERSLVD